MKLPTWFSSPKKTDRPLTSAEISAKLAEAAGAHQAADQRIAEARATFAAERTETSREALRLAKAEAADVSEMLAILKADHAAAVAREQAEQRAKISAECEELEAELNSNVPDSEGQALLDQELELWNRLTELRMTRHEQHNQREGRIRHYRELCAKIDRKPITTRNGVGIATAVKHALEELAQATPQGERRNLVSTFAQCN